MDHHRNFFVLHSTDKGRLDYPVACTRTDNCTDLSANYNSSPSRKPLQLHNLAIDIATPILLIWAHDFFESHQKRSTFRIRKFRSSLLFSTHRINISKSADFCDLIQQEFYRSGESLSNQVFIDLSMIWIYFWIDNLWRIMASSWRNLKSSLRISIGEFPRGQKW